MRALSRHSSLVFESMEFLMLILCSSSGHLDTSEVTMFLQDTISQQNNSSFNARLMFGVVKVSDALIMADPDGAFIGDIHITLFNLINKALGSLSNPTQPGFFGVEFKSDPSNEEFLIRNVIDFAELSLKKLAVHYCRRDPDTRVMHWFLFCRSLCLSARPGDEAKPAEAPTEEDAVPGSVSSTGMTGYRQYVTWCMQLASSRSQNMNFARSHLKCLALSCATEGLKELFRGSSGYHGDVSLARAAIDRLLDSLDANAPTDVLLTLPCYASLFLEDMVALCCTCATYTVEDVQMRRLQLEALNCLATVIHCFKNTPDPHDPPSLILCQFMSQIMSAIRPCLSVKYSSALTTSAGSLICILIQNRFLDDKVLLKRVAKSLFPFLSESTTRLIEEDPTESAILSPSDISEEFGIADYVVSLGISARMYTTSFYNGYVCPNDDVKSAVLSVFDKNLDNLTLKWLDIVVSAVLVVHGAKGWITLDDFKSPSVEETILASSKLVRPSLVIALPHVIVACICTGRLTHEQLTFLFACLTCTVTESGINKLISESGINNLKFSSLLGLIHMFRYPDLQTIVPPITWEAVIRKLLKTLKNNTFSSIERLNYVHMLLQLAHCLGSYIVPPTLDSSDSMMSSVWLLYLSIFSSLFPDVIGVESENTEGGEDVNCFPMPIDRFAVRCVMMKDSERRPMLEVVAKLTIGIMNLCNHADVFREYSLQLLVPVIYWVGVYSSDQSLSTLLLRVSEYVAAIDVELVSDLQHLLLTDLPVWKEIFRTSDTFKGGHLPAVILELWCYLDKKVCLVTMTK
jgi:hypothetical protein